MIKTHLLCTVWITGRRAKGDGKVAGGHFKQFLGLVFDVKVQRDHAYETESHEQISRVFLAITG